MNLIWFLTIGTFLSTLLGEFGHYPFASVSTSVSLTDLLLIITLTFLCIWQIGIKKNLSIPTFYLYMLLFFIICILSLIFSGNLSGGLYLLRFIPYSVTAYLGYQLILTKQISVATLVKLIIIVGVLFSLVGVVQLIFYPDFEYIAQFGYDPHKGRLASTFLDPNFMGAFLNIPFTLSLFLSLRNFSRKYLLITLFLLIAIILTFSRSAYLMLFTQLFLFGVMKYRKLLIITLLGLLLFSFAVPRFYQRILGGFSVDTSASARFTSWERGVAVFEKKPILGVGFDNLRSAYEKYNLIENYSPNGGNSGAGVDSSLLLVLATTGFVGFGVYLAFWINVFKQIIFTLMRLKSLQNWLFPIGVILFSIMINSQFINSLFYPPIMLTLFSLVGVAMAEIKLNKF